MPECQECGRPTELESDDVTRWCENCGFSFHSYCWPSGARAYDTCGQCTAPPPGRRPQGVVPCPTIKT
jgi:hypothetical protein